MDLTSFQADVLLKFFTYIKQYNSVRFSYSMSDAGDLLLYTTAELNACKIIIVSVKDTITFIDDTDTNNVSESIKANELSTYIERFCK